MKRFLCAFWALALGAAIVHGQPLANTEPLTTTGDLAAQMVEGIDRYLMRGLAASPQRRSSGEAEHSGVEKREELARIIGVVDERIDYDAPRYESAVGRPSLVAAGSGYEVHAIRWPVLEGVDGEGLLLQPAGEPRGFIVALPDADWTPEMAVGLESGSPVPFARRLAESGFLVVVPALVNRDDTYSGKSGVRFTNQPHREFIYRMAYEMGRHIIGYEVQKVLALVDWFEKRDSQAAVGVIGYGEGGLLALHSAALDTRIDATVVSGYFAPRENVWREPIYRNVWSQLERFGDAEIAQLIAPRTLVIEASVHPAISGPPPETDGRRGAAPGRIATPDPVDVRAEVERARAAFEAAGVRENLQIETGGPGSDETLTAFIQSMHPQAALAPPGPAPTRRRKIASDLRQRRQFQQLVDFTQRLVRRSEFTRAEFFSKVDFTNHETWERSTEEYRRILWEDVIGKMPPATQSMAARTRRIYETTAYTGYEVVLPVWEDVFAYGILLVPHGLKPGERRPVVVCQHGLEGRPQDLIDPPTERLAMVYGRYGARLAEEGYIVFAPQNPYIGREKFRVLQRMGHPQQLSLFSFILGQHQRTLEWFSTLPFVDAERIGFYGLSYGGKTAMRLPPLLKQYALSICSADFNEWIWKITAVDHSLSYMYTVEHDMLEFNLGNTFNYAEMAALIAPRPFMVERGHRDGVGIDEWVAYEYARVRRLYTDLGIAERTEIEFFDGPHQIHGEGTFEFLRRHLQYP